jgi:CheY-like chemotaxis protein
MTRSQPAATPGRLAPAHILVLDDDPNVREILSQLLLLEGHDVETAESLSQARTLLDQHWDAALIDVRLGSRNGLDFLAELRARQPDVVAVVLTGFSTPQVALRALQAGADDYFGKPVDLEKIKIAVRRGLDRVAATTANRALIHDLRGLNEQLRHARSLLLRRGVSNAEEGAAYFGILSEGAAREIRGPLAAIRTSLEVLNEGRGGDDRAGELIDYALGEAGKIERVLANLVSLVRPSREAAVVDLAETLQSALRFAGEELSRRKITALADSSEVAPISAEPWSLLRTLLNLVLWSVDRMPSGGRISAQVRVSPEEEQAECRLADTGPVPPAGEMEALFEPLDPKSSGALGLPAARAIIEAIGGRVWAEPNPAGGIVFCIRIPLAASEDVGGTEATAAG